MLRNLFTLSTLLLWVSPLQGSGYLSEVPDYLAHVPVMLEGLKSGKPGYLNSLSLKPLRVDFSCKICQRHRIAELIPAPPVQEEDIGLLPPMAIPEPSKPLEVSAGADPAGPDVIIGGKRLSKKRFNEALIDPKELLSVFEKDVSKKGGPEEKVHIPFSMPYDSNRSAENNKVPSKALYMRE